MSAIQGEDRAAVMATYDRLYGDTPLSQFDQASAQWLHQDRILGCVKIVRQAREQGMSFAQVAS